MPHTPKPFFKTRRNTWYVEISRIQHVLGKHPKNLPTPVKKNGAWQAPPEIQHAFCKLMATPREEPPVREVFGQTLVLAVFEDNLEWCQRHKAALTYEWYRSRIQAFAKTIDRHLPVSDLKPIHLERWVDAHPQWSPSHQRGCKIAVQRAFTWATKMGVIDRSPVPYVEKPEPGKRDSSHHIKMSCIEPKTCVTNNR